MPFNFSGFNGIIWGPILGSFAGLYSFAAASVARNRILLFKTIATTLLRKLYALPTGAATSNLVRLVS